MKLNAGTKQDKCSATLTQTLWLILAGSGLCALTAYAADPSWWSSPGTGSQSAVLSPQITTNNGVVTTNYVPNNYAAVNQGQLKQFTARAVDELNSNLSGGAGTNLNNLVQGWAQDYATNDYNATNLKPSDYTAISVGQLKYIGNKVWSQLVAGGYTNSVPSWLEVNTNSDTELANIGQLKTVFNFTPSVNPLAPVITSATSASGTIGVAFSYTITASNSPTSFNAAGLPAGLSVNTGTGVISGIATTTGTFHVYLSATNAYGTGAANLTLTIYPPAPVINSVVAASGATGTEFSYTITASNWPTSFNATGLPAGLSVDTTTGVISGTPTVTGTFPVALSATYGGATGTATLTLTVSAAAPVNGIGIQFQGSGTALLSTDSAGLPNAFQSNWNVLSGFSFTNQALIDSTGASTTATLSHSYSGADAGGGSTASPAGNAKLASGELLAGFDTPVTVANIPYAQYDVYVYVAMSPSDREETVGLTPSGGTEQFYSFTTEGGGSAWTVATSTWNGSGSPPSQQPNANYVHYTGLTASSFTVAWEAPGNGAINGIQIVPIISAAAPPVITSAPVASGAAGAAFNYSITATNSSTSYTATGLPAGLSLNTSTGVISGTPTAMGTFHVNLSATNAYGTGTAAMLLTVNATVGIGIQFVGSGTALSLGDSAGLMSVFQSNWNVLLGSVFAGQPLFNSTGASTTATLSFPTTDYSYSSGAGSTAPPAGNAKLASGELLNNSLGSALTVSNIPYAAYDVYVYGAMNQSGRAETVGLTPSGGTEQFYSFTTEGEESEWTAATSTWNGSGSQPDLPNANYVHYSGLTANSFTLAWDAPGNGAINGIQIVPTSPLSAVPIAVAGGSDHTLIVKSDGSMEGWGRNQFGQLGLTNAADVLSPTVIPGITQASAVATGGGHTLVLNRDTTVLTFGDNYFGQLGDSTTTDNATPHAITNFSSVVAIAAGEDFSVALKSGGTVWTWGSNAKGQLGQGDQVDRSTPTQISGLSGVQAIACGRNFVVALTSTNTVIAWGDNSSGQLGDGSTTNRLSPVAVTGLTSIESVVCGAKHGLAIDTSHTVWSWGADPFGQAGNASLAMQLSAQPVSGISGAMVGAGGWNHSMVMATNQAVWTFGAYDDGQLGTGTNSDCPTPVPVSSLPSSLIGAGYDHSASLKTDQTLWTWGRNAHGQLGNGTTNSMVIPAPITY